MRAAAPLPAACRSNCGFIADARCHATRLSIPRPAVPSAARRDRALATLGGAPQPQPAGLDGRPRVPPQQAATRVVSYATRGRGARGKPTRAQRYHARRFTRSGGLRSTFAGTRTRACAPEAPPRKSKVRCLSSLPLHRLPTRCCELRGVLRVLREWGLARSAPTSSLACACALHLMCRDAGFLPLAPGLCWESEGCYDVAVLADSC